MPSFCASSWRTPPSQPTWPCGGGAFWCGPPILRSPIGWRAGRPREFLPTPRPLQAANRGVCGGAASATPRIRSEGGAQSFPTTWPAGRAAVRFNYVLRPAGFIGHCNVRSSLNLSGAFRTSKKRCLRFGYPPKWGRPRPSAQLSCHRGGGCTLPRVRLGPAGHVGGALFPLTLLFHESRAAYCPPPALGERRHRSLARRLIAVRGALDAVGPVAARPHPRAPLRRSP
jgi:hypothetical protein